MAEESSTRNPVIRFFSSIWKWIRYYLLGVGLFVTLMTILGGYFASQSAPNEVTEVAEGGDFVLELTLDGPLKHTQITAQQRFFADFFGESLGIYLPSLRYTLNVARSDERVKGLFLNFKQSSGSLIDYLELQEIIMEFKESGKPVRAYFADSETKELIAASAADKIAMPEVSNLFAPGPALQLTYFGKALEKLGVNVEVIQTGKFKSAFEPFVRNSPSEDSLEAYMELESSLRQTVVEAIAKARKLDPNKVSKWLKEGMFSSESAKFMGIVDEIAYLTSFTKTFIEETAAFKTTVSVSDYRAFKSSSLPDPVDKKIALIEAVGEIHNYNPESDPEVIEPARLTKELEWAAEQEDVASILLVVDSPGGSATASDIIWDRVAFAASKKPVIVSMGASAASGGYYISAPATHIMAHPATITGSIGVIGMIPNFAPFEEKYGVSFLTISETERKSLIDPGSVLTDKDHDVLKEAFKETYKTFIRKVGKGRSKTPDEVDTIGQGRVWTGTQALENGLIDSLGGVSAAISKAKELGGIDVEATVELVRWRPKFKSFGDCLLHSTEFAKCFQVEAQTAMPALKRKAFANMGFLAGLIRQGPEKVHAILENRYGKAIALTPVQAP